MSEKIINYITIKKFSDEYFRITNIKTYNRKIDNNGSSKRGQANREKLDNSISRSKAKIFEYAICNDFDYFVTLTIDPNKYDRKDLGSYYKDLSQFIRDYRKKYKSNIQYVLVPEKHKDGSWHMHGLIKGILADHLVINEHNYLDWDHYSKKFGWISLDKIRSRIASAKYITKYVTKDHDQTIKDLNKKTYYCSRGLKKAETISEGIANYEIFNSAFTWDFSNDYVNIKDMTKQEYDNLLHYLNILDK